MTPSLFIKMYAPAAINTQISDGIPASITLAQAALESGWGKSTLSTQANNFFGIKDQKNDEWYGEYVIKDTAEYLGGQKVSIKDAFRKYSSPEASFKDHVSFLRKNSRYKSLFSLQPTNYLGWATGLQKAGYSTSPVYAATLVKIITDFKLDQYDRQAEVKKK